MTLPITIEKLSPRATRYRLHVNGRIGWRQHLAHYLRALASRIDHRHSLAIAIDSIPALSTAQQEECINVGLLAMSRSIRETVSSEMCESVLRERFGSITGNDSVADRLRGF